MKKLLGLAGFLAMLSPGAAVAGVGTTVHSTYLSDGTSWVPSLDIRTSGWLFQIHALELVGKLPDKTIDLGLGVSKVAVKRKVGPEVEGVVMPGGSVRLLSDTSFGDPRFNVVALTRIGAEMKQGMGFGFYAVPMLGVSNASAVDDKIHLAYGGGLEISAWLK